MKKIYIVDAVNYLFRSYYAIGPMTNNEGQSTSALYGFIRTIEKLQREMSPDYLMIVFDGPDNKKSRQIHYADYKMHRKGAPEDLFPQFELTYKYCELTGLPTISIPGIEADDTMASIAKWARKKDLEVYLCTTDKDLYQLVDSHIFGLNVHKDNLIIDREEVINKYGVPPEQMLDLLAIMGDKSDNIPGLSGFGPKTAASLLSEFGSLEEILNNPEKVKGAKKQETLIKEKDIALLSKKLATLNITDQIPDKLEDYKIKETNTEELAEFYKQMKFNSLLKEIASQETSENTEKGEVSTEKHAYHLIDSEEKLQELEKKILKEKEVCIDTETDSLSFMEDALVGIGFCFEKKSAYYVPLNGDLDEKIILNFLKKILSSKTSFFGHNLKFDYHVLLNKGLEISNISFDTLLASYLINPQNRRHNLDQITLELFSKKKIAFSDLTKKGKKNIPMSEVPIEEVTEYCCEDVDYTLRIKEKFEKIIEKNKLEDILYNMEIPLIPVLAKMEKNGIYIDLKKFETMSKHLKAEVKKIEHKIYTEAGEEFNINSPKQLSKILFEKLELAMPGRKKTEYSTGAQVLEKLKNEAPIIEHILDYRTAQKLISTYIDALPKQINEETSRIHPTFNQSITATGRLSCQDPNLQNIPIKSKEGKEIREAFVPQKRGWSFISADYSQIELRILAHFSKDKDLIEAFKKGEDIHTHTASTIFEVPKKEVTSQMRRQAKAVNFGILYGQGAYGLSENLNISHRKAKEFIEAYFEKYPTIKDWIDQMIEEAKKTGVTTTLFGRLRPINDIHNKNPHIRAAAERLAINTPLQGTAADIIKKAMIDIDHEITKKNLEGFLVLQIHDELIFEVPDSEIPQFKKIIESKMTNAFKLAVPLEVDISVGKNWGEC
ncbi:MAG TPA: DNA polymerase I [Chlamydiales bacterium]|nr:DNA polymerase I [Chlamydiales bacterium]